MSEPARRPITVVGSLMVDVFARAPSWPTPSRITHGEFGLIDSGGKGANQALIAARMGWPTCLIGCVGLDWIGAALLAQLNAGGVDTTRVLRTAMDPTGLFIALSTDKQ
ncbi:MAG: carbohydrate kinase family protein, partial [Anaerolineae bacterium]|nr:carbohydrate kinase family protein [Thermoflexales bacterium]MDW8408076.1 carbohydrate kinase family protein [Anaerolineae bacterium]